MVLDTSALLAILMAEPEAERSAVAIDGDPIRLVSAGSLLETAIVAESRWGDAGGRELDLLQFKGDNFAQTDVDRVEVIEAPD